MAAREMARYGEAGQRVPGLVEARVAGARLRWAAMPRTAGTGETPVPHEQLQRTICDCRRFALQREESWKRPRTHALCRPGLQREASYGPSRCGTEPFPQPAAGRDVCRPLDECGR